MIIVLSAPPQKLVVLIGQDLIANQQKKKQILKY